MNNSKNCCRYEDDFAMRIYFALYSATADLVYLVLPAFSWQSYNQQIL